MFQISVVVLLAFVFLAVLRALFRSYSFYKQFPGLKLYPVFGNFFDVIGTDQSKVFNLMRKCSKTYGTFRFWALGNGQIHTSRAKEAEILLSSSKHTDKSEMYRFLTDFLGTGLLISNGQKWQKRRKILTPAFHFHILQQFQLIFNEESAKTVKMIDGRLWEGAAVIDVSKICCQLTLNIICETAMGVKLDSIGNADDYRKNLYKLIEIIVYRVMRPWLYLNWVFKVLGYQRHVDKCVKKIQGFTKSVIDTRRKMFLGALEESQETGDEAQRENIYQTKKRRYAMLDTLLSNELRGQIDAEGVREEVDTFMFEGHDTTSSGLTFSLLLIASHQDVQQHLFEELKEAVDRNNGEPLSMSQFNGLPYLDRVLKECLRIYSPVTFISRNTTEELELEGVKLKAGTMLHLHILDVHKDPQYYPAPDKFDPDRFLPENVANRNPYAFIPFSAGPRNCVGQKFATLEMKTVIQYLVLNFYLTAITKREDIKFIADLVLRAQHPILVQFKKR